MGILSNIGKAAAKAGRKAKRATKDEFSDILSGSRDRGPDAPGVTFGGRTKRSAVIGQKRVADYTKKRRLEGGTVGAIGGSGATLIAANAGKKDKEKTGGAKASTRKKGTAKKKTSDIKSDGRVNPSDYPIYQKNTKSGRAFRKAFKEAVTAGKKTFKFEGRTYSTKKKSKKPKAAGGMLAGSSSRFGHKDYRKGGLFIKEMI